MEGTLGGRFTTVEGLIVAIKEQVRLVCYSMEGTFGGKVHHCRRTHRCY